MTTERQFFATGVLSDARVFAVGGEYATGFAQDGCPLGEMCLGLLRVIPVTADPLGVQRRCAGS